MKQIKLEVGKTYRSRSGKEVEIARRNYDNKYPYIGSNDEWYTESGRWEDFAEDAPEDLIEEVTVSDANQKHNEMEVLVLQVGKTYLNRKGEEVRIIKKYGGGKFPYNGNNGRWYAESGRWSSYSREDPQDLIEEVEEVRTTRHTFKIPDGTKEVTVEQVGNRIVVEMVPEKEPKPGDVMVNKHGSVYVFKEVMSDNYHEYYALLGEIGRLSIGSWCYHGRPATPEEAQPLWDALKKAGKMWNAETMRVEDVPESERIMDYLKDYENNVKWNHEQLCWLIEQYLRHKEAK